MKKRVISAIVALIIVIPIIFIGGYTYYFGVGLLALIGYYEILNIHEKDSKIPMYIKAICLVTYLLLILSGANSKSFDVDYRYIIADLLACLLPLVVVNIKNYTVEDCFFMIAITLFLGFSFNYLIVIRNLSIYYLLYTVLITIMSDTFAHFFGTQIGRIKLCPDISPNKTVEGMIGGSFFGTFIGSVFFLTFINQNANVFLVIVMSLALSMVAQFGDLVFSAFKRKYGVKDYGKIMPGHGGVLDRLDSIIFAVLAFAFLVLFF